MLRLGMKSRENWDVDHEPTKKDHVLAIALGVVACS